MDLEGHQYGDFDRWAAESGNDGHSIFADPAFTDAPRGRLLDLG